MKKYLIIAALFAAFSANAQDDVYPSKPYAGLLFIKNGTVHVGNGQVLERATIQVNNGKIEKIGVDLPISFDGVKVFDATGKHVYPGLIMSATNIGLREIASQVKGSNDYREIGDINPNIKSIVAYNADSKIINTLRSNGILLANVVPQGSLISGTSSVVQFDAWNWEDAVYKMDNGMHFYMPSLLIRPNRFGPQAGAPQGDPLKAALDRIEYVKAFFKEAKAYNAGAKPAISNLKFEATKGLFDKSQRLFIHCDIVKEMLITIDFVKEFGFNVTIIGGSESFQLAPLLKQNNISVILEQMHSLPTSDDDDVDQTFKTPAILQKAGVLFAITDEDDNTTGRNLMFNAGTASSYGLTKEEALQAITLNAAKILGIDQKTGSLEVGKDANIIISEGDLLDMKTSIVTKAFIQGRDINLLDKHKQLNERYKQKYGVK
ncbi:MAG: amidohydrolase [Pedobacter sp.]|nr:MAG: amidohydrolase [Pedobacter sp.]